MTAAVPSGRDVRRWTRRRSLERSVAGLAELFIDVYTAIFGFAITAVVVLSVAAELGSDLGGAPPVTGTGLALRPGWIVVLLAVAAMAATAGLAARLGPVSTSGAQATWWLGLPVDRRRLLRPAALRWPAIAGVLFLPVGGAVALSLTPQPDWLVVLASGGLAGAAASAVVLAIGLAQLDGQAHRRAQLTADLALAATPAIGVALALVPAGPPVPTPRVAWAAVVAALGAAALAVRLDRRLAHLHDASLRHRGAVTGAAQAAVLFLDTRALGRALFEGQGPRVGARSSSLWWLARLPVRLRPLGALLTGDALLLLRSPRHLVQLVVTACLPCLALAVPRPSAWLTVGALLTGSYGAGLATAEAARRAQVDPAVDALLPLSQHQVRAARLVLPAVALVGWSVPVFAAVAWRHGDAGGWLTLGVLAAPAWAAAGNRAAYRELPDLTQPMRITPLGPVPAGIGSIIGKGPDLAAIGSIPVVIALLVGEVAAGVVVGQVALTALALAVVGRAPARRHRR